MEGEMCHLPEIIALKKQYKVLFWTQPRARRHHIKSLTPLKIELSCTYIHVVMVQLRHM